MTWSTDGTLKVPAKTRIIAELRVEEEGYSCRFKTTVTIRGRVLVTINSPVDNNNLLMAVEGNVVDVLNGAGGRAENGAIRWEMEGQCDFRYGVGQNIHVKKESLR
jgi:hypothetical protein